ncbi:MAG: hypothetical protein ACRDTZ_16035 [Pseudonocardiaceae bacterium]
MTIAVGTRHYNPLGELVESVRDTDGPTRPARRRKDDGGRGTRGNQVRAAIARSMREWAP